MGRPSKLTNPQARRRAKKSIADNIQSIDEIVDSLPPLVESVTIEQEYLFVYGAMKSHRPYHGAIAHLEQACSMAFLPFFKKGNYRGLVFDAVVPSNFHMVSGELYKLPTDSIAFEEMLETCDRIEGAPGLYYRVQLPVIVPQFLSDSEVNIGLVSAYVYVTPDYVVDAPIYSLNHLAPSPTA